MFNSLNNYMINFNKSNNLSIFCRRREEVWTSCPDTVWWSVRNIMMEIIPRAGRELLDNEWLGDNMSLWERETERQRDITICQCQTDAERLTTHAQYEHPAAHQHHSEDQKLFYILRFSISEFSAGRPCHLPASATWYYSSPQVL